MGAPTSNEWSDQAPAWSDDDTRSFASGPERFVLTCGQDHGVAELDRGGAAGAGRR